MLKFYSSIPFQIFIIWVKNKFSNLIPKEYLRSYCLTLINIIWFSGKIYFSILTNEGKSINMKRVAILPYLHINECSHNVLVQNIMVQCVKEERYVRSHGEQSQVLHGFYGHSCDGKNHDLQEAFPGERIHVYHNGLSYHTFCNHEILHQPACASLHYRGEHVCNHGQHGRILCHGDF